MMCEDAIDVLFNQRVSVGSFAGCYAFMRGSEVLYIGQSKNIRRRLYSHVWGHLLLDDVEIRCVPCDNHKEVEAGLIKALLPKFNGSMPYGLYKKRKMMAEGSFDGIPLDGICSMPVMDTIDKIELAAKAKGISIAALCKMAGISNQSWQNWKNGKHEPRIRNIHAFRKALGL